MIRQILACLQAFCPLRITFVEWKDPVLSLCGDNWSLTISSPWRVISEVAMEYGCWDASSVEAIKDFHGLNIIDAFVQSTSLGVDPVLILSNGKKLEIFSIDAVEPWVLRLPDKTFVASPTDIEFASSYTRPGSQ